MPEWITQVIYLLPIAGLIWKAALQSGEIKQLRKDVDNNHTKLNNFRDTELNELKSQLSEIIVRLTRIETQLETTGKANGRRSRIAE